MVLRSDGKRRRCQPCANAYQRHRHAENPDPIRERKRADMARRRADPVMNEKLNAARRGKYRPSSKLYNERLKAEDIFRYRARQGHRNGVTADVLRAMWGRQGGRCALTGRPLGDDFQVDHVIPRARGGTHALENLRLVCPQANVAKRDLTDAEFIALCREVLSTLEGVPS